MDIRNEDHPEYRVEHQGAADTAAEDDVLKNAKEILAKRLMGRRISDEALTSMGEVQQFLALELAEERSECFAVIFLDTKYRPIAFDRIFFGTLDSSSIYPREVARMALQYNAGAVVLAHNHPSGVPEPSDADLMITNKLIKVLRLFDIRVLDHIIVGESNISFAERGCL